MRLVFNSANEFGCFILLLDDESNVIFQASTTSSRSSVEELSVICGKIAMENVDQIYVNIDFAKSMILRTCLAYAKGLAKGLGIQIFGYKLSDSDLSPDFTTEQFLMFFKNYSDFCEALPEYKTGPGVVANVPAQIVKLKNKLVKPLKSFSIKAVNEYDEDLIDDLYSIEVELFNRDAWSKQSLKAAFDSGYYWFLIVYEESLEKIEDNHKQSFSKSSKSRIIASSYVKQINDHTFDIDSVGVSKSYQNLGVGRLLMDEIIKFTKNKISDSETNNLTVNLDVRTSNYRAISLYKKFGFEIVKTVKHAYNFPLDDGYLMQYKSIIKPANDAVDEPITLGIETSCDETGISLVRGHKILGESLATSLEQHQIYGGVIPEIAARTHLEVIDSVLDDALKKANVKLSDIEIITVTAMPGLVGCLAVGVSYAKGLYLGLKYFKNMSIQKSGTSNSQNTKSIKIFGVNHLLGHLLAAEMSIDSDLPENYLGLIVSGGHSDLIIRENNGEFRQLGSTIDDAAGEAFDKVGRLLGLKYPAGQMIDNLAKLGDQNSLDFPRPLTDKKHISPSSPNKYNFSFSGLKTSALRKLEEQKKIPEEQRITINDFFASFQSAVVDSLVFKTIMAAKEFKINTIVLGGGFSANSYLRKTLKLECQKNNICLIMPEIKYCTDNGSMIANLGKHLKDSDYNVDCWTIHSIAPCSLLS